MSLSFLERLRQSIDSPASAFHEFVANYDRRRAGIHAFFEGRDDASYYVGFIQPTLEDSQSLWTYRCGGKAEVYEIRDKILRSDYRETLAMYFVDRDWDEYLDRPWPADSEVYTTDYYSIENGIVTREVLVRVCTELIHCRPVGLHLEELCDDFDIELKKFYDFVRPICVWAIVLLSAGYKPPLDNISLGKLCKFDEDLHLCHEAESDYMPKVQAMCGLKTPLHKATASSDVVQRLKNQEPKSYVRGKYELWFFVAFVSKLIDLLHQDSKLTVHIRTQISMSNALEVLGPRAGIPNSLAEYLTSHLAVNRAPEIEGPAAS